MVPNAYLPKRIEMIFLETAYRPESPNVVTEMMATVRANDFLRMQVQILVLVLRSARSKESLLVPLRDIVISGIDKLMSEYDEPPNVDSVMRPLRNSKTQRRVVGKIDSVWPISNAAPD